MPHAPAVTRLVATATVCSTDGGRRRDVAIVLRAELDDGRSVVVDDGRGFSATLHGELPDGVEPPPVEEADVRDALIPDDEDDPEPLPWAFIVDDLAAQGVETTVEQLRAVPYDAVLVEAD